VAWLVEKLFVIDETKRQSALELYELINETNREEFDRLARLAALICDAPISLVSLLDNDRQWFKGNHGLVASETPRAWAFCQHAIESNHTMVVEDALTDERFKENPLVTDDPNIRFYAGAPLLLQGQPLGTLCIIDQKPRQLTAQQLEALEVLRDSVVRLIEVTRALQIQAKLEEFIHLCAWCRDKVKMDEGDGVEWVALSQYVSGSDNVSHSICPECERNLMAEPSWSD
jgi:GAF domain-containing protein